MSMKKAIDQTLRDLKRGVNKKVLKVPSVEQKVLDATSNEPWGPHGSLLADIAQATRNYHEYQMIMAVLWKRINDTGKNWRHVYKALTVLEYMVSHGSERVIDDIREHAYQISTLSDFQYIDSSGRDQGNNVRRKSQSLVALVSDKERIQEVREKAATNRDKFRSSSAGGMYRPGSGGYGDDRYEGRYGGRDDDRNGYGRERDGGFRDDERYGRYGDSYNREGDRYGRDYEDHYGRDSYRDDDSRGRTRSEDEYQYGSRSKSSDRVGDRAYDEDDRRSSQGGSVRADDNHNDGRRLERKFSEQNLGAPPSYEEAVGVSKSPTYSERDGETPTAQLSSPTVGAPAQSSSPIADFPQSSPIAVATPQPSPVAQDVGPSQATVENDASSHSVVQADSFDEFDPRGSVSAAPSTSHNAEMDLLGSLTDAFSPGPLAIMPASFEASPSNPTFAAVTSDNTVLNQSFEDPFGDSPFKAIPSDEPPQPHNFTSTTSFQPSVTTFEHTNSGAYNPADSSNVLSPSNPQNFTEQQSQQPNDMLAGILPPSAPFATSAPFAMSASQTAGQPPSGFGYVPQPAPFPYMASQNMVVLPGQLTRHSSLPYSAPSANSSTNVGLQSHNRMASLPSDDFLGGLLPQGPSTSEGPLALVLHQSEEKKFETKSTVWADTLNRGLVNLNISGSKINPLSDIGIDFESLNRKEKRMEKPSTNPAASSVSMGKAMGSGSGIGRAGAGVLRPTQNQMMGSGMGMGMGGMNMGGMAMGGRPGVGMGMNYVPVNVNQQSPMGMGMGMGMGMNMGGMGVNMGMGQGVPMQPSMGQGAPMQPPHGSNMGSYPMMGRGGYPPQQPYQYGGGYR